jgi:hypothetical protein
MLPGLADLRGNVRRDGQATLFSTGNSFPPFSILGTAFDWTAQSPARGAVIEAVSHPDTNLVYIAAADSAGNFDVGPLPAGTYLLRGFIDQNSNRIRDRTEKWDSVTVGVTDTRPHVELDMIERDSVPAVFDNITYDDSVTLHVSFDKPLDPRIQLQPSLIRVQRPDSSELQVAGVQWASAFDKARQTQRADSLHRADTTRADTTRRPPGAPDTTRGARPAPSPTVPPRGTPAPGGPRAAPAPPKPKAPPPEKAIVVNLSPATPASRGSTYRITAHGLRNLVGNSHEITRTFTVPKVVPRDTTKQPAPDTTRRPPPKKPPL